MRGARLELSSEDYTTFTAVEERDLTLLVTALKDVKEWLGLSDDYNNNYVELCEKEKERIFLRAGDHDNAS